MNTVFKEIILGIRRAVGLLRKKDRMTLGIATFLMLITGILSNGPAVILVFEEGAETFLSNL